MSEDKILKKLVEHDRGLKRVETQLNVQQKQLDHMVNMLVEHDARLDKTATKDDLGVLRQDMLTSFDTLTKKVTDMHLEQVATNHALFRHEEKLTLHDTQIKDVRLHLKIA